MKKIALAAALTLAGTSAFAGGLVEPVTEPEVVEEQASSSSAGGIIVPLLVLLLWTLRTLWRQRVQVMGNPLLLGTAMAATYLLLGENMLKVGMRQPYPGIITFFIWGLLIARLRAAANDEKTRGVDQ